MALTPVDSTSVIRSASCDSSSSSCLLDASIACTCCGKRCSHKDLSTSSDAPSCARSRIRRNNCDGRRSPRSISFNNLCSFFSALSAKLHTIFERDVPIHRGRIEYDIANFGQRVVVKALYHIIISCVVYSYACGEELSFHLYEPEVWLRFPKRHGSNSDSRKRSDWNLCTCDIQLCLCFLILLTR
ncbi:PREDICTED: uncharacterized protein LOC105144007 isoform X1 [Acromyrmex echinatior]|uniref:uncharacterized protein LOC105144007 isoform X1 n=1 Tax=Acromyrmex echinatior TaxID=103372 RepID=UPI000580B4B2|nr:PREDICTED: uncharacterized protein LOC105144007 isoform X1 [Acromyrmex echinatior]